MSKKDVKKQLHLLAQKLRTAPNPNVSMELVELLSSLEEMHDSQAPKLDAVKLSELMSCSQRKDWIRVADIIDYELES